MIDIRDHGGNYGGGGSKGSIKSVQRGSLVETGQITSSGLSIPIEAVDTSKAIVLIDFGGYPTAYDSVNLIGAELISATEIKIYSGHPGSMNTGKSISWQVVEFENVRSLQRGKTTTVVSNRQNHTVNISPVNLDKAVVFASATSNNGTTTTSPLKGISLTNESMITLLKDDINGASTFYWQVVEFN